MTDQPADKTASKETQPEVVEKVSHPEVRPGYTVRLHLKIQDGKKERIQVFEGIVLKITGATPETRSITVRKQTKGFGVEKIIPLAMPTLDKIEVVKTAKVRRSKLYFLRSYGKRLKEQVVQ